MHLGWSLMILVGCVPSRSTLFDPVDREVERRTGVAVAWSAEEPRAREAIATLLAKPLDLDAAVRIALARNHRLQARYDELGIAASRIAEATVLPPLTVDFDYKRATSGHGSETEVTVIQDVLALLQITQRRAVANVELAASQARAVAATVELAAHVEVAFDNHVAAKQELALVQTAFDVASAAALLVERQHAAGNTTELALAREQEQRERLRIEVARAVELVVQRRAQLGAALGLAGDATTWDTSARLPEVPAAPPVLADLEPASSGSSLEIAALRADADAASARHRFSMIRAVLPELGAGVAGARRAGEGWEVGPAVRIGLPLFDQQQGPRARALAEEKRARDELSATATELHADVTTIRSHVMQAYGEVRQLTDVVLPLRQRILEQTVLQYNAMNASTFELLAARRDMVDLGRQLIDASRRYWNALAEAKALRRGGHVMPEQEMTP